MSVFCHIVFKYCTKPRRSDGCHQHNKKKSLLKFKSECKLRDQVVVYDFLLNFFMLSYLWILFTSVLCSLIITNEKRRKPWIISLNTNRLKNSSSAIIIIFFFWLVYIKNMDESELFKRIFVIIVFVISEVHSGKLASFCLLLN